MSKPKKWYKTFFNAICYIFISLVSASISIATFSFLALFIWFQSYLGEFRNFTIKKDFTIKEVHYYPISLEQAPNHLKNAFLASNAIYNFDPLLKYVANKLLRRDPKPIRDRMFKEAFLTLGLKLFMPKDDLFAFYLDCIYLGNNSFGVEAGARIYFAKHVEELTLAEAAALAVLSVGPAEFNPFKNPEILKQKQPYVLKQMLVLSWISEAEYNQAVSQPLVYKSMLNRNK